MAAECLLIIITTTAVMISPAKRIPPLGLRRGISVAVRILIGCPDIHPSEYNDGAPLPGLPKGC